MIGERELNIAKWVVIGIIIVALASAVYNWYSSRPMTNPQQYTPLPEVKEVVKIKRVKVPGPKEIVTIEKEVVVEKLKLPNEVKNDPNKQVIATGEVPPYEGKTNVVAVMDTQQGTTSIIAKQQPLPLFAFKNQKEIGIRGGYAANKDGTRIQADAFGRWTFVRIGNIHLGLYGEVNTNSEGKAMIESSYRF
jgi:hypothetical protein